jgi:hypothetical protein
MGKIYNSSMATPNSYEHQPGFFENLRISIVKNFPMYFGRFLQTLMYGIYQVWRFILQLISDAFGR